MRAACSGEAGSGYRELALTGLTGPYLSANQWHGSQAATQGGAEPPSKLPRATAAMHVPARVGSWVGAPG